MMIPCSSVGLARARRWCKEVNVRIIASLFVLSWAVVSACAPPGSVFPSKVMEDVDRNFDFSRWRMVTDGSESKKVQLGGRILQSQVSGDMVTKEDERNHGDFVIIYQGQIQSANLQAGNRVMVVGTTRPWKVVTVNDLSRSFPIVAAQCLHFWNTQGRGIQDFPFYEAGYVTLRQETVCAKTVTP